MAECRWCGSTQVIRWGARGNKQKWRCKTCGRYFTHGKRSEKRERHLIFNYSLGYVIGVLVGDGSLSKWRDYHYFDDKFRQVPKSKATKIVPRYRYGVQLNVKDRDFAEAFAKHLKEVTGRDVSPYPITREDITEIAGNVLSEPYTFHGYKVQQTNKKLYEKLTPLKEDLSWIRDINIEVKRGFLRGFFDSDGGASKRPRVHLTNKKIKLLQLVKQLLSDFGIKGNIYPNGSLFRLWIHSKENVKRFYNTIGFSINRKKIGEFRL